MNRFFWKLLSFIFLFTTAIGMEKDSHDSDYPVHKFSILRESTPYCSGAMSSLALSPDGSKIAFSKKGGYGLWDIPTASGVTFVDSSENKKVVWVPQEQNLFGTVSDVGHKKIISLWDTRTKKRISDDIELSRDVITDPVVFTEDGNYYFVGNQDGSITVFGALDVGLQKFLPAFPMSGIKDWHAQKMPQGSILSYFCNQVRCGHIFFLAHCLAVDTIKPHSQSVKAMALSAHESFLASYAEHSNIILTPISNDDESEREQKDIGLPARPAAFLFDDHDNLIVSRNDGALVSIPPYEYNK